MCGVDLAAGAIDACGGDQLALAAVKRQPFCENVIGVGEALTVSRKRMQYSLSNVAVAVS